VAICGPQADSYHASLPRAAAAEAAMFSLARAVLPPAGVVVDAGANIGMVTLGVAPFVPLGRVYAFEPGPLAFRCLATNVAADPMGNAEALNLALADKPGLLALYENPGTASANQVVTAAHIVLPGKPLRKVSATTVDAFAAERDLRRLDLLKVDVEGFEPEVLAGAVQALAWFRPVVALEFNSYTLMMFGNRNPRHVMEVLLAGFRHVFWFDPAGRPQRIGNREALHSFLHDHLLHRQGFDNLACGDDDGWLARYVPPG
jgi:FkbM family methyltransferase